MSVPGKANYFSTLYVSTVSLSKYAPKNTLDISFAPSWHVQRTIKTKSIDIGILCYTLILLQSVFATPTLLSNRDGNIYQCNTFAYTGRCINLVQIIQIMWMHVVNCSQYTFCLRTASVHLVFTKTFVVLKFFTFEGFYLPISAPHSHSLHSRKAHVKFFRLFLRNFADFTAALL